MSEVVFLVVGFWLTGAFAVGSLRYLNTGRIKLIRSLLWPFEAVFHILRFLGDDFVDFLGDLAR